MADPYKKALSVSFARTLKKLKATSEYQPLTKKMDQICANPSHYKPLRGKMAGKRRTHLGSMVLVFTIDDVALVVTFLEYCHHDEAYE